MKGQAFRRSAARKRITGGRKRNLGRRHHTPSGLGNPLASLYPGRGLISASLTWVALWYAVWSALLGDPPVRQNA